MITTHSKSTSFRAHLSTALKIAYYRYKHDGDDPPSRTRCKIQELVKGITTQDLRHSYVSILRENGVDSELRAKLAGHSRQVDESIYTHVGDPLLKEAVEKAFGGDDSKDDADLAEALEVCRAMLSGEPVVGVSPDAMLLLRRLQHALDLDLFSEPGILAAHDLIEDGPGPQASRQA